MLRENNYFSDKLSYENQENYQYAAPTALKEREVIAEDEKMAFSRQNSFEEVQDQEYFQRSFDAALERTLSEESGLISRGAIARPRPVVNEDDLEEDYPMNRVAEVQAPAYDFDAEDRIVTQTITSDFASSYPTTKTRIHLSKKVKTAIALYAVLMVALLTGIILSVLSLIGIHSNVESLQSQVGAAESEIGALAGELDSLNNADQIQAGAGAMGMGNKADAEKTFDLPEIVTNGSFKADSNWFDDACDFISNLFS